MESLRHTPHPSINVNSPRILAQPCAYPGAGLPLLAGQRRTKTAPPPPTSIIIKAAVLSSNYITHAFHCLRHRPSSGDLFRNADCLLSMFLPPDPGHTRLRSTHRSGTPSRANCRTVSTAAVQTCQLSRAAPHSRCRGADSPARRPRADTRLPRPHRNGSVIELNEPKQLRQVYPPVLRVVVAGMGRAV